MKDNSRGGNFTLSSIVSFIAAFLLIFLGIIIWIIEVVRIVRGDYSVETRSFTGFAGDLCLLHKIGLFLSFVLIFFRYPLNLWEDEYLCPDVFPRYVKSIVIGGAIIGLLICLISILGFFRGSVHRDGNAYVEISNHGKYVNPISEKDAFTITFLQTFVSLGISMLAGTILSAGLIFRDFDRFLRTIIKSCLDQEGKVSTI